MTEVVSPVDAASEVGEASSPGLADPLDDLEAAVPLTPRDCRRTYNLDLINGAPFPTGDIFIDTERVGTWLLSQLGASDSLIGFAWPLRSGEST